VFSIYFLALRAIFCKTVLFCLRTLTLNLSKSVKAALLCLLCNFLAHEVSPHFLSSPKSSIAFLRMCLLTPLATSNFKSVREILFRDNSCLLTPVVGPSTRTLVVLIISTMTANLPALGP
jgi:hypothetical protein